MTRRINLLPPEIVVRRRSKQRVTTAVMATAGIVAILGLFFLVQAARLSSERSKLEAQEQENAQLQARVGMLEEFDRLAKEVEAKTRLVDSLTAAEVRWSVVLADVSLVIPSNAWLTTFSGSVSELTGATRPRPGEELQLGRIDMVGVTFSHVDVAKWLVRLAGVEGFTFPYLSLSTKAEIGTTPVVNFASSVQLSEAALRKNQRGAGRPL